MGNYDRGPLDDLEAVRGAFHDGYGQVGQQYVTSRRALHTALADARWPPFPARPQSRLWRAASVG
jgi:hypothetical protein